jgi:hypothetical protein
MSLLAYSGNLTTGRSSIRWPRCSPEMPAGKLEMGHLKRLVTCNLAMQRHGERDAP